MQKDTKFNEDSTYNKSIKKPAEEHEETEVPRIQDTTMNDANQDEDQEIEESHELVYPPQEKNSHKIWGRGVVRG